MLKHYMVESASCLVYLTKIRQLETLWRGHYKCTHPGCGDIIKLAMIRMPGELEKAA